MGEMNIEHMVAMIDQLVAAAKDDVEDAVARFKLLTAANVDPTFVTGRLAKSLVDSLIATPDGGSYKLAIFAAAAIKQIAEQDQPELPPLVTTDSR
jgi:hypothetical protein